MDPVTGDEIMPINLSKIGGAGLCKTFQVTGGITQIDIFHAPDAGIVKLKVYD